MEQGMQAMCGAYCGICEWKEKFNCPGCRACAGKPFWGKCDKASCCMEKGLTTCGGCPDLPCDKLCRLFADAEHGDQGARLRNLKRWAAGGEGYEKLR